MIVKEIIADEIIAIEEVSKLLEQHIELQSIAVLNWSDFSYLPKVSFRIAHSNNQIWLKFYVEEKSVVAAVTQTNGGVANDSCVEFFFDPFGDGNYYNFEFNCIGVIHVAHGPSRNKRIFVNPDFIERNIQVKSSLDKHSISTLTKINAWDITVVIPAFCLVQNEKVQLKGLSSKANFYKCGDQTAEPHYVSWKPVGCAQPDFHRPEYFKEIVFE